MYLVYVVNYQQTAEFHEEENRQKANQLEKKVSIK